MHGPSPTPRLERSAGIDIARGFALLGIILVNARFFFLPLGSAIDALEAAWPELQGLVEKGHDARLVARILRGIGEDLPLGLAALSERSERLLGLQRELGAARLAAAIHVRNPARLGAALDAVIEDLGVSPV